MVFTLILLMSIKYIELNYDYNWMYFLWNPTHFAEFLNPSLFEIPKIYDFIELLHTLLNYAIDNLVLVHKTLFLKYF